MSEPLPSREEMLERLRATMVDMFAIDPAAIKPSAVLGADLDIDSIDAIDLAVRLEDLTGIRLEPEQFKQIRTVGDILETLMRV